MKVRKGTYLESLVNRTSKDWVYFAKQGILGYTPKELCALEIHVTL